MVVWNAAEHADLALLVGRAVLLRHDHRQPRSSFEGQLSSSSLGPSITQMANTRWCPAEGPQPV